MDVEQWLDDAAAPGRVWYLKRLSANDTQYSRSHQAGPYIPRDVMFRLFPTLNRPSDENPGLCFDLTVDGTSASHTTRARAVWYNNKLHGNPQGGRNEGRITRLGGASSPLLDIENTGALAVLAFQRATPGNPAQCRVWICSRVEEDLVEGHWGPVEPGEGRLVDFNLPAKVTASRSPCWLQPDDIPSGWLANYPTGEEIIRKAVELRPLDESSPDSRLIERRKCEFEIFRSLEEAVELPVVQRGFEDLVSFIQHANTILQRRKSRSGLSLELHVKTVLNEENFDEGHHYSYQAKTEQGKRPDFLFPNKNAYHDPVFPGDKLRMLAVKTTCRDRWRQILNEANRIPTKHLLTLQEGVSPEQYREMRDAGVRLVVPTPVHSAYGNEIRSEILGLHDFLQELRTLRQL